MELRDKLLKMHEVGERVAVEMPTITEYKKFMENTFPEDVLVHMWSANGSGTCIAVIDETGAPDFQPLSREIIPLETARERGLELISLEDLDKYPESMLPRFTRGDRVKVDGHFEDVSFKDVSATVTGLKCERKDAGFLWQEVTVPGTKKVLNLPENLLTRDESHAANHDPDRYLNKEKGRIREPAGQKRPV